jgi:ADP-ribose pyrophosphatase YjhB (NUDIX family)
MHDVIFILLGVGTSSGGLDNVGNEQTQSLRAAAKIAGVPIVLISNDDASFQQLASFLPCVPVICGEANLETVSKLSKFIRDFGATPLIPIDALILSDWMDDTALNSSLSNLGVHLALTEGVSYLFKMPQRYVYAYPKPDVSASLVVIMEPSARVILVRRKEEPFAGMYSVPGGFLQPLTETLESCACREFKEETGVALAPEDLQLLSVQSSPLRDPRGHVINSSYLAVVRDWSHLKFKAGDDARSVELVPLNEALNMRLAADHNLILRCAAEAYARRGNSIVKAFENFAHSLGRIKELPAWAVRARPA